jgi:hypothetical protein
MNYLMMMIEQNRKKMIELSELYGLASDEVVQCSQELDILINLLMEENTKLTAKKSLAVAYK